MKRLALVILMTISTSLALAQDDLYDNPERSVETSQQSDTLFNFFVQNNDLIWQKIYQTDKNIDDLATAFLGIQNTSVQGSSSNRIILKGDVANIDFTGKYKIPLMKIAPLIIHELSFVVIVDIKDFQYRVTVNQIKFKIKLNELDIGISRSLYVVLYKSNKGKFSNNFQYSGMPLDIYFSDIFSLNHTPSDNW